MIRDWWDSNLFDESYNSKICKSNYEHMVKAYFVFKRSLNSSFEICICFRIDRKVPTGISKEE